MTNDEDTAPGAATHDAEAASHADIDLAEIGDLSRYEALMRVMRNRITSRAFDPAFTVPDDHYDLILEAARHAPSGANAQPPGTSSW